LADYFCNVFALNYTKIASNKENIERLTKTWTSRRSYEYANEYICLSLWIHEFIKEDKKLE